MPDHNHKPLGQLLLAANKLSSRDIERALLAQAEMGGLFGQVLVKLGVVSDSDVAAVLAVQLDIRLLRSADYPATPIFLDGLAEAFLFNNLVVPVVGGPLPEFASTTPQDEYLKKALAMALGCPVVLHLGLDADINQSLSLREQDTEGGSSADDDLPAGTDDHEFVEHLKDLASEAPVIRLVNQVIHTALDLGASDIHVEPFEDRLHLRYRVDGIIQEDPSPPALSLAPAIASRIKLLARINIAERRLPQDGRIMIRVKGHELDLRVSTIPTVHGESVVMRVLDRDSVRLNLDDMGFSPDHLKRYRALLAKPHGVLLLTGPTGSGKTTTLYASLAGIDASEVKIITVEDPVEYQIDGINQVQVQPQIELTFARALRAILRQDPDIIMIGEMRDTETAQIAVQSALTGHLVLSTLHTNTAAGAITRLEDMGIERFLITSSINGVLAQRLVRKLCAVCRTETPISEIGPIAAHLTPFLSQGQSTIFSEVGCGACKFTGYRGRSAIHELFALNAKLRDAIQAGADTAKLQEVARRSGMLTLYEDGLRKVALGETSLAEVARVTQDQSDDSDSDVS
ncbi:GspE/PulE family protein [Gilvimarinus japonicus]|uniref:GspE/PulE family protein n=1 Tax=Gilvimarinus japonicus TaxID=1796469 RepID=A0ABV7HVW6_9GAMM